MEEKEIKKYSSQEDIIKESSIPKDKRKIIRKKLSYIESLEQPGTIYNAEVHGSAQRLLKVHRITKYVKFCKCCSLPQETPGVVVPFNICDKQTDFGLGIYLYFYYIKFCILMSFISICLASVATILFSLQYSSDLNNYCDIIFKDEENIKNLDKDIINDCTKFSTNNTNETNSGSNIIEVDWLISMSAHNIKHYHDIFKYNTEEYNKNKIEDVALDYSFMYFITGITVLIVDYLFVLHINLLDECQNFEETTPRDYTLLIHGVPKPVGTQDMNEELLNIVRYVSMYTSPLQIYQIIPCLKIGDIFNIAQEKYEEETKLYHIYNFERQKLLNKKYGYRSTENFNNLHYFVDYFCIKRKTPIQDINNKIMELNFKLNELLTDLKTNPNKYNGGSFFIIFSTMQMQDEFYNFFPHSYGEKLYWLLRYFFECILFKSCINEDQKLLIKSKISVDVRHATEPYEIYWENMGYTRFERNAYKFISFLSTIGLIIVSLGIIIGLNKLQNKVSQNNFTANEFLKYFLSFLISIMLAVANIVGEIVLQKLTIMEKIEYKTNFYISFSIKLTVYSFIIIAILPIAANYINNHWGNNDLLVNNMLMIFITNILLPPVLFYLSPGLVIKIYKRIKAKLDLKNVKLENSIYTQGELNEIFENPIMNISYKYSYITNVFLISLFYLSIFPIGMIFGFFALLFAYISEFFYIGLYKRPEILNSKLCKTYVYNFKWIVFIFSLGNYLFIGWMSETRPVNWSVINLIVFFILCLIPYQSIKINTLGMTESESKKDTYEQNSIFFSTDYEKLCPFTRKEGFLKYFQKLLEENIVDEKKCQKIIDNIQNLNEMDSYLKSLRHMEKFCATQELNNIYMKNKNELKIQYMFGESNENKQGFSLAGLKNIIMDKSELNEEKMTSKDIDAIREMKDTLLAFSTTNTGICNALIFLGEKNNINDEFDNYHFNPWKAEWIFTPEYKMERKAMIHKIRSSMDYRGEISDDEDSIVKFDDKKDSINEVIKKLNDKYLKKRESVNVSKNEKDEKDQPMINNAELTNVEVNNNKLKLSKKTDTQESKGTNLRNSQSDSNQRLSLKEIVDKNNKNIAQSENNINTSESKLITDSNLFPKDTDLNLQKFNQQK
jgi:hypothetical protein